MNEWGVPDWKRPEAYESFAWTESRWYWEFLRRRDDLREDFDAQAPGMYAHELELHLDKPDLFPVPLKPEEAGFYVLTKLIHEDEVEFLPNPRISNQPIEIGWWRVYPTHIHARRKDYDWKKHYRVEFDLNLPIERQIRQVKRMLLTIQKEFHGKTLQSRQHQSKWLTYLQVIDARAEGASWSEIADILTHTVQSPQSARDTHEQATALCFNFFG